MKRSLAMKLLEREAQLRDLHAALERARQGRGTTVLVSGEAGIGKTWLLRAFAAQVAATATRSSTRCSGRCASRSGRRC